MASHVRCSRCGKAVSREVDGDLVVRAFVECPECVEKQPDWKAEAERLKAEVDRLKEWQRQMVEKAAEKSLDGYRELGAKCASLEAGRDEMEKKARLFAGWADDGCTCEHDRDDGIPTPCVPCQARAFLQRAKPTGPSPAEPEVTALMKAVETDLEMHDASWRDVYERFQTGYTLTHEDRELLLCYAATITELREAMEAARKRWPM